MPQRVLAGHPQTLILSERRESLGQKLIGLLSTAGPKCRRSRLEPEQSVARKKPSESFERLQRLVVLALPVVYQNQREQRVGPDVIARFRPGSGGRGAFARIEIVLG